MIEKNSSDPVQPYSRSFPVLLASILVLSCFCILSLSIFIYVAEVDNVVAGRGIPMKEDARLTVITSPIDAYLEFVLVEEGNLVRPGQRLMTLSNYELERDIDALKKEILRIEAELIRLQAEERGETTVSYESFDSRDLGEFIALQQDIFNSRQLAQTSRIKAAEEEVSRLMAELDQTVEAVEFVEEQLAQAEVGRAEPNFFPKEWQLSVKQWKQLDSERQQQFLRKRLNTARLVENEKLAELAKASAEQEQVKSEIRAQILEEISDKTVRLDLVKENLSKKYEEKSKLTVVAEQAGILKSIFVNQTGTPLRSGAALLSFEPDASEGLIVTTIPQSDIHQIKIEQPARVRMGNQLYEGTILAIQGQPTLNPETQENQYDVLVKINEPPSAYTSTLSVQILAGKKRLKDLLTQLIFPIKTSARHSV